MKTLRIVELIKSDAVDCDVTVTGWVRTKRGNKNVAFIALNDGSCVASIQVVVELAKFDDETMRQIATGACIRVISCSCSTIPKLPFRCAWDKPPAKASSE